MNESLSKMIIELLEINNSGKATVFVQFSGHVNQIEVRIYLPKWYPNADSDFIVTGYLDKEVDFDKFETEVSRFIKLFKVLNQ